jgi:hypothetical protein
MQSRKKILQTPGVGLDCLTKEHSNIHRQYIELDDAILQGQGSPRILEAARTLMQFLRSHLAHEEQFQRNIALPISEYQADGWTKNMAELLQIDAGLNQKEVYSALRLRSFCKRWTREHMHVEHVYVENVHVENVEFDIAAMPGVRESGRVPA